MLGAAGAACAIPAPVLAALADQRKHVLHIPVDDLRCALGCYGDEHAITPNMDRLAAGGTLFERAYVPVAICSASRASILTGTRPATNKVTYPYNDQFRDVFIKEHPTFTTHLERQGAWSAMLGKIHHSNHDDLEELDRPHVNGMTEGRHWKDYADPANDAMQVDGGAGPAWESADVDDNAYRDGKITDEAVALMRRYADEAPDDPLLLSVGYVKPHLPFNAPKKYFDLYDRDALPDLRYPTDEGVPDEARASYELGGDSYAGSPAANDGLVEDETARDLTHAYYACVSYVDAQVGRLLDALDETGLADDTVIVLWGDHGFHLGEQQVWGKHVNYEVATRVPFLWSGPNVPAGRRVSEVVEVMDTYRTLCDLTDAKPPRHVVGKSLVALMHGRDPDHEPVAFSDYGRTREYHGYAIRIPRWRYIEWRHTETGNIQARELYDHDADPAERVSVAEAHPDVTATLSARLAEHYDL